MMDLKEALQDSGLAEAWYDNCTAVVVKENHGYKLSIQHQGQPPHFLRSDLSLEQVENEMSVIRQGHPTEWSSVDLEG